ncbi:hypothetical protein TVAG_059940 [Trichomonas vaginalis G3]|uniref:E2F/DP family winged-helix DNA-binding domain-containing protein n=1 Tax=Trichomonas vaginalis (strain ATCC PRA-98 / G3) TaxID=412133 RepID=A2FHZ7_TRIV3|nr:E2F TDP 2 family [Trichomonas vaginalis G3]EAX95470.1 hypothetical protein TVAG_059940 [Trichomonas vaginalis G3]KAI5537646.1 E2F TDP 2 family [Trichomonas vaginalis G3]|eukprot:XP_001308400.1 hypothetical protein [Trichomonas vaginalis G3]
MKEDSASQREKQKIFKVSVTNLVNMLESHPGKSFGIPSLCSSFKIKRRRFYDIVNVFVSLGCCQKLNLDRVEWLGKSQISNHILTMRKEKEIDRPEISLDSLFPVETCVGVSNLTINFVLLFYALKSNKIDIRMAGQFLSRGTGRYKTTLCKLYQINLILATLGMTSKSSELCSIVLRNPYMKNEDVYKIPKEIQKDSIMSILYLLNKPEPGTVNSYVVQRRYEMKSYVNADSLSMSDDSLPDFLL